MGIFFATIANSPKSPTTTNMSARKLQQEFDKLNKKIAEGLQTFEDTYEKLITTDIALQRDKLELDLKKEIKRLQRLRDQLKIWMNDLEIKLDKLEIKRNRTQIEHAMDMFKELEKSLKIKQFSNEGLELQLQGVTLEQAQKKKTACDYISAHIEELNHQNETLEVELHSSRGKKKIDNHDEVRAMVDRNVLHLTRLETILRALENHELNPEKIDLIQDDLDYYVENNMNDDFVDYDDFYDQLEFDDLSHTEVQGSLVDHHEAQAAQAAAAQGKKKLPRTQASQLGQTAVPPQPVAPPPVPVLAKGHGQAHPATQPMGQNQGMSQGTTAQNQAAAAQGSAPPGLELFEHLQPQQRLHHPLPFAQISHLLELLLLNCPDSIDAEKPKQYNPVNIHPLLIDYPQEPMLELNLARLMLKFEVDTLQFCFYYSEDLDVLARYHAAKELSKRGWVFNTETKQWFLKDTPPPGKRAALALEDNYKYFDYEKTWLIRRRENFNFPPEIQQTF